MSFVEKLHQQLAADNATLLALREGGDNSHVPRMIEHQFTCPHENNLGSLGYLLEQMQFGEANLLPSADGFRLELSVQSAADWSEITRTSVLMKCLAAAFQVEYQGWGSPVVSG